MSRKSRTPQWAPATLSEYDGVRFLHLDSIWVQGAMRIRRGGGGAGGGRARRLSLTAGAQFALRSRARTVMGRRTWSWNRSISWRVLRRWYRVRGCA